MGRKPNFILFITDQHRADHVGCYGNQVLQTPAIDGIAARGTRFDRFYVTNPACMPNRAALMTGRTSSVNGVRSNGVPLSLNATTFVDLLRAGGYRTGSVGKIHLQNMTSWQAISQAEDRAERAPPPRELDEAYRDDRRAREYDQESQSRWRDPDHDLTLPYYGFEHVDLTAMHSDNVHGHYRRWLEEKYPGADSLIGPENACPSRTLSDFQAWRTRVPAELYSTSYIAEKAADFLRTSAVAERERPFFLQCSFNDPHHPFTPPGRYFDMYDPADVPLPATFHALNNDPPVPVRMLRAARDSGTSDRESWMLQAVHENDVRQAIALTYGSITMIDDAIARVLAELDELGLADDTVILFTSDHGDFMGDHQLILKGPVHYDGLVRVPFVYCDPSMAGSQIARTDRLASTMDVSATVLDRAGLAPFNGLQGQSLLETVVGGGRERDQILIEEDNQRAFLGFAEPVRLRTLVTPEWRLSLYRGATWGELYHLSEDPHELRNLWSDPAHAGVRADLVERLAREIIRLQDNSPLATARA